MKVELDDATGHALAAVAAVDDTRPDDLASMIVAGWLATHHHRFRAAAQALDVLFPDPDPLAELLDEMPVRIDGLARPDGPDGHAWLREKIAQAAWTGGEEIAVRMDVVGYEPAPDAGCDIGPQRMTPDVTPPVSPDADAAPEPADTTVTAPDDRHDQEDTDALTDDEVAAPDDDGPVIDTAPSGPAPTCDRCGRVCRSVAGLSAHRRACVVPYVAPTVTDTATDIDAPRVPVETYQCVVCRSHVGTVYAVVGIGKCCRACAREARR